jgi:uncharacterized protein (TIRG00374 family)
VTANPPPWPVARFSTIRVLLGALLGGILIAVIVRKFSSQGELLRTFRALDTSSIAGPFAWSFLAFVLSIVRWRLVLAAMGFAVPFLRCLRAVLAAWPVAAISPGRVGDGLRALALREDAPMLPVLGSVLLEKIFDLHSLALLAALGFAVASQWLPALLSGIFVVGFWVCFFAAGGVLRRRGPEKKQESGAIGGKLASIADSLGKIRSQPGSVAGIVGLSLLGWLLSTQVILQLLSATGQELTWSQALATWPAAVLASALPISISGVGARDGAFLLSLRWVVGEVENSAVVASTLLYPLVTSWTFALAGVPFLASLWKGAKRT